MGIRWSAALSTLLIVFSTCAAAQDEIFSDGFESGDICGWSNADPEDCPTCEAGEFSCSGNSIMQCNYGPPPHWVPTGTVCDPTVPNRCDAQTGTCQPIQVVGDTTATGSFFQYAYFLTQNSEFLGGCDVGTFGDLIYVNRGAWYSDGMYLDVYRLELEDTDGDGEFEPDQHPDNPSNTGPIEHRTLSYVTTYVVPELGRVHRSEIYPLADRVYFIAGTTDPSIIFEYVFATGLTTAYAVGTPTIDNALLGYGQADGLYYSGAEYGRIVYSLDPAVTDWVAEFEFPNMTGGHFDGLEVVVDPSSRIQYLYVAESTSDYIGQYRRDPVVGWVKENVFEYQGTGTYVEGMGFGALNHIWFTGDGTELYEVGGGDLTPYFE